MRERKYKAWVKDRCEFFPVFEIDFYDKSVGVWGCGNENCGTCSDYFDFDEIELIEYTGLKDKNGVEIFEGDIVQIKDHAFQRKEGGISGIYIDGNYVVRYTERMELVCGNWILWNQRPYITVVGNIYENPELLKEDTTC